MKTYYVNSDILKSCMAYLLISLICVSFVECKEQNYNSRNKTGISAYKTLNQVNTEDHPYLKDTFKLSDESKLIKFLLRRYKRAGTLPRPIRNASEAITVDFGIALIQILDFDETNQVLTTNIWKRYANCHLLERLKYSKPKHFVLKIQCVMRVYFYLNSCSNTLKSITPTGYRKRWKDELLVWDPKQFGNVSDILVHADDIWVPDIVLYNKYVTSDLPKKIFVQQSHLNTKSADNQDKSHEEMIAVYSDGWIRWIPPAIYKSSCSIDMRDFPFDTQTCHFKFGSWMYDGRKLALSFYDNLANIDLRNYINSSEFIVVETWAEYHVIYYPCCGDEPFPDITYYIRIQRRPAFHIYILILPSILLSFLTLVLFWIPPQRPDRTSLGMSLFSSFFVLLLILVQSAPPTSASISLLGVYYCINMVLVAVSTMLSAVVINLTHYLQKKRIPKPVKVIFVDILGRLLCAQCAEFGSAKEVERSVEQDMTSNSLLPETYNSRNSISNGNRKNQITHAHSREWNVLAAVIDRIFFLLYCTGIILSIIFVFPR